MYVKIPYNRILNKSFDDEGKVKSLLFWTADRKAFWVPVRTIISMENNVLILDTWLWRKINRELKLKKRKGKKHGNYKGCPVQQQAG